MIFGIPREIPPFKNTPEYRVGFSPMAAKELMLYGAKFYVETKAGEGAGFSDDDYEKAGATVVYSKEEAYRRADIVLKVRRPQQEEYPYMNEGQVLMGFIHMVTARKAFIKNVQDKKMTIIGYEIMQNEDGRLPVVIPMSEMAGRLSVQIAGRLLESPGGGRGILLGGIAGIPPAEVVIMGAGTLGCNSAKSFAFAGANVYVDVTVTEPLAVSPANVSFYPGQTAAVTVSGGAPGYTAISGNPSVADVAVSGDTVTMLALGGGTITVTITFVSGRVVTVDYASSDDTATAGTDYTASSGTLSFAAGETSKTFSVPITDNSVFKEEKRLNLNLSSPGNATLGSPNSAGLVILEDDSALMLLPIVFCN